MLGKGHCSQVHTADLIAGVNLFSGRDSQYIATFKKGVVSGIKRALFKHCLATKFDRHAAMRDYVEYDVKNLRDCVDYKDLLIHNLLLKIILDLRTKLAVAKKLKAPKLKKCINKLEPEISTLVDQFFANVTYNISALKDGFGAGFIQCFKEVPFALEGSDDIRNIKIADMERKFASEEISRIFNEFLLGVDVAFPVNYDATHEERVVLLKNLSLFVSDHKKQLAPFGVTITRLLNSDVLNKGYSVPERIYERVIKLLEISIYERFRCEGEDKPTALQNLKYLINLVKVLGLVDVLFEDANVNKRHYKEQLNAILVACGQEVRGFDFKKYCKKLTHERRSDTEISELFLGLLISFCADQSMNCELDTLLKYALVKYPENRFIADAREDRQEKIEANKARQKIVDEARQKEFEERRVAMRFRQIKDEEIDKENRIQKYAAIRALREQFAVEDVAKKLKFKSESFPLKPLTKSRWNADVEWKVGSIAVVKSADSTVYKVCSSTSGVDYNCYVHITRKIRSELARVLQNASALDNMVEGKFIKLSGAFYGDSGVKIFKGNGGLKAEIKFMGIDRGVRVYFSKVTTDENNCTLYTGASIASK